MAEHTCVHWVYMHQIILHGLKLWSPVETGKKHPHFGEYLILGRTSYRVHAHHMHAAAHKHGEGSYHITCIRICVYIYCCYDKQYTHCVHASGVLGINPPLRLHASDSLLLLFASLFLLILLLCLGERP